MILVSFLIEDSFSSPSVTYSNIKIKNVDRLVDISTQLVKITHSITFENVGKDNVRSVIFLVCPKSTENVAFVGAQVSMPYLYLV